MGIITNTDIEKVFTLKNTELKQTPAKTCLDG